MAIKAVIFDFDGLILDTESNEYHAHSEIFKQLGVELPIAEWGKCIGTDASAFDVYAYLEELVGKPVDRETLKKNRHDLFTKRMSLEGVRPGVREYLQSAQALDLRIGLASSSSFAWVSGYLEIHKLAHYFETIRTREDVVKVKPSPELYQKALEDLGVLPSEAIAFEDSPNGSLAAKRAGMYCVIVPNSITGSLVFGETDLRLDSMEQMSLSEVIVRFN
ncbi:HAD family hydrolase [Paenibacillus psychroresistens]|uniref:HAD family hydrolase n=1 Tax=Paenibacillus psychroresistens TaxID=1778678 RepID=A0A6B8RIF2_9BACL|nr:HAD family hydrolase [Paenibacillus psychroresistens]QGQ95342.1 HAD family hydrolase [Paenibacillus psychroresistens]